MKTKTAIPAFIEQLNGYSESEKRRLTVAYEFARIKHQGQKRKSGEPYVVHPQAVTVLLASWGVDLDTLQAGMLHDTLEDTDTTREELVQEFGEDCTQMIEGVTKIGHLRVGPTASLERSTENIRKLLLAMSRDIRVILVKLADRLHNMRTIQFLPEAKRQRIAQETLDVFAPLADRLAMGDVKAELEDRAFAVVDPERYGLVKRLAAPKIKSGKQFLNTATAHINADCTLNGLEPNIEFRIKHLYSLNKKLVKYDQDFNRIRDLVAIRIIVASVEQCYQVLGLVHGRYKPLPQYIKDYIAVPKPNGYQSLHTTVLGERHIFEVQIRTHEMHQFAENGLAAHFFYDERKGANSYRETKPSYVPKKLEWVQNLLDWQDEITSEYDTQQALKFDVFNQRIFVFSPNGDLFDLPEGSTPIDFAFHVHTQLGLTCRGVKVNGQIVGLDHRLQNRDVVEIFAFHQAPKPSRDWLSFVVTGKARSRLKAWFRTQSQSSQEQVGRVILNEAMNSQNTRPWHQLTRQRQTLVLQKLGYSSEAELFTAINDGQIQPQAILRELLYRRASRISGSNLLTGLLKSRRQARPVALIHGIDREQVSRAGCCSPHYPELIVGYIPRQGGCRVHRVDCRQIDAQPERHVPAYWYFESSDRIKLTGETQSTATILKALSHHLHIFDARAQHINETTLDDGRVQFDVRLSVVRMDRLPSLLRSLERIPGVVRVEHILRTG